MPRDGEMIWRDKCGIFVVPQGKKPGTGERAAEVLTDTDVICTKCAARHGITAQNYQPAAPESTPAPAPEPEPTPAPVLAQDPAQAALEALPAWIKEDGARHGRNRLKAATAEAERLSAPAAQKPAAPRPAPPKPEALAYRPPAITAEQEELAYLEARAAEPFTEPATTTEAPAPADRDTKEDPKPARPVRRPARPRRETTPAALAALAPASDTDEAAAAERIRDESVGAPAPRPWSPQGATPAAPAARPAARPAPQPIRSREEIIARRRELAEAYAARHGADMAPPARRPIVTAEEIRTGMRRVPVPEEDAPLEYHPDVYLKIHEAARYAGRSVTTLSRWRANGEGPAYIEDNGMTLYQVRDLEAFRASRATVPAKAPRKTVRKAAPAVKPQPTVHTKRQKALARLETFAGLVGQGLALAEAAEQAGYVDPQSVRGAARRLGRPDVAALVPDGRKKSTAAQGRAA